jgi:prepilin-type N-terminal cleavage/methylation domain-containing protein
MAGRASLAAGFTLVEIMLALAIFMGVVAAIYASWMAILRSSKIGLQAAADAQRNRIAIQAIEDALNSLQFFTANARAYAFVADTEEESASISFVARLPKSFPRSGRYGDYQMRRVNLSVESTPTGTRRLVLRQYPFLSEPDVDEEENPLILAEDVRVFHLEFWGPRSTEWESEWLATNQLPRIVRFAIGLGIPGERGVKPQDLISHVVVLPTAGTPPTIGSAGLRSLPGSRPPSRPQPGADTPRGADTRPRSGSRR